MMTREEAQKVLLLYRPGTPDAADPEVAEALALAARDAELSRWLDRHCAQQEILRGVIRQTPVPAGLREQIISERPSFLRRRLGRRHVALTLASLCILLIGVWAALNWCASAPDENFSIYRGRMISAALRGYSMDLETSDPAKIRSYLQRERVAENYRVPAGLQKASATGCAVESWRGAKVALLCFSSKGPAGAGGKTDVWLYVVNRDAVKDAPSPGAPQFAKVNKLMTATWSEGDKLYLLGGFGDESAIRRWF